MRTILDRLAVLLAVPVIDIASGTVIASLGRTRRDEFDKHRAPYAFFPGSLVGYRRLELPDGTTAIQLTELRLVAR